MLSGDGPPRPAVRAYGHVETLADQITSRASTIHKIVGRMLHLN